MSEVVNKIVEQFEMDYSDERGIYLSNDRGLGLIPEAKVKEVTGIPLDNWIPATEIFPDNINKIVLIKSRIGQVYVQYEKFISFKTVINEIKDVFIHPKHGNIPAPILIKWNDFFAFISPIELDYDPKYPFFMNLDHFLSKHKVKLYYCCAECYEPLRYGKSGLNVPPNMPYLLQIGVDPVLPCQKHPQAGFYILGRFEDKMRALDGKEAKEE